MDYDLTSATDEELASLLAMQERTAAHFRSIPPGPPGGWAWTPAELLAKGSRWEARARKTRAEVERRQRVAASQPQATTPGGFLLDALYRLFPSLRGKGGTVL